MVRISDLNYDKLLRTLSLNFSKNSCSFEKLYQKLPSVFHPMSRQLEVGLRKLGCASFFNPLLGVWISDEVTLRVVFDISHEIVDTTILSLLSLIIDFAVYQQEQCNAMISAILTCTLTLLASPTFSNTASTLIPNVRPAEKHRGLSEPPCGSFMTADA